MEEGGERRVDKTQGTGGEEMVKGGEDKRGQKEARVDKR